MTILMGIRLFGGPYDGMEMPLHELWAKDNQWPSVVTVSGAFGDYDYVSGGALPIIEVDDYRVLGRLYTYALDRYAW